MSSTFSPIPSHTPTRGPQVAVASHAPAGAALGILVAPAGPISSALGLSRQALAAAGFDGAAGTSLTLAAADASLRVAVGTGPADQLDCTGLRTAAATFARAAAHRPTLALSLDGLASVDPQRAQALVEGVLLARYSYDVLRAEPAGIPVEQLTLIADEQHHAALRVGVERGRAFAAATMLARDLANTPHSHLNATRLGELADELGREYGFAVETFDRDELERLGCGGLLAVNQGSVEPPRMIKLSYRPAASTHHLALVGKGVMYDSGGLSLKPSDAVHAQMKNDMSGAAAVLAAVCGLATLGSATAVTGWLACTDNMPSGSAMALGDVITIRDGTTVEVEDTDAEGRLILADALVLAGEEQPDAIVDIATLTGSALRALGPWISAVLGTSDDLLGRVATAAAAVDEPVWQMPLHEPYRDLLASQVADVKNVAPLGWPDNIMASLFLSRFTGNIPWAHIDICGPAWNAADRGWHTTGCSGVGARMLLHLVDAYSQPAA